MGSSRHHQTACGDDMNEWEAEHAVSAMDHMLETYPDITAKEMRDRFAAHWFAFTGGMMSAKCKYCARDIYAVRTEWKWVHRMYGEEWRGCRAASFAYGEWDNTYRRNWVATPETDTISEYRPFDRPDIADRANGPARGNNEKTTGHRP